MQRRRRPSRLFATGHTVLVVEDVPVNRLLIARACASTGASVVEAEDGRAGLQALRAIAERSRAKHDDAGECLTTGPPSGCTLVVLDRDMPVLDGFGFLDALIAGRSSSDPVAAAMATVRVEGCTGNAVEEIRDGFLARGAVGVMNKPVHRATIVQAVARAVRSVAGGPGTQSLEAE